MCSSPPPISLGLSSYLFPFFFSCAFAAHFVCLYPFCWWHPKLLRMPPLLHWWCRIFLVVLIVRCKALHATPVHCCIFCGFLVRCQVNPVALITALLPLPVCVVVCTVIVIEHNHPILICSPHGVVIISLGILYHQYSWPV